MSAREPGQHMAALARAQEIRRLRAGTQGEIATGAVTVAELLRHPPMHLRTARVYDILRWQHRWGPSRAEMALRRVGIANDHRALWLLSDRQRHELARIVADINGSR